MKAIIWTKYGAPDGLKLSEIKKPTPRDNEVLIKVHATSVTAGDCELRSLKLPIWMRFPLRIYAGFMRPKRIKIIGQELSGINVCISIRRKDVNYDKGRILNCSLE